MNAESVTRIGKALFFLGENNSTTLQSLILSQNNFGAIGVLAFVQLWKVDTSLRRLDLVASVTTPLG